METHPKQDIDAVKTVEEIDVAQAGDDAVSGSEALGACCFGDTTGPSVLYTVFRPSGDSSSGNGSRIPAIHDLRHDLSRPGF